MRKKTAHVSTEKCKYCHYLLKSRGYSNFGDTMNRHKNVRNISDMYSYDEEDYVKYDKQRRGL